MKKRLLAVLLTAAMSFGLLAGCNSGGDAKTGGDGGKTEGDYVGMIFPALNSEMLIDSAEYVQDALEEQGCKVELVSSDNDAAKEKQQLETFASMGVDKILLFPMGATGAELGDTLQGIRDQGIEVYIIGCAVTDGCFDGEQLVDNAQVGQVTAEVAAQWIDETFPDAEDGSVKVGLLTTTTTTEAKAQSDALYEIEKLTPKAKIVDVYDWAFTDPVAVIQDNVEVMLEKNPDLKAILAYDELQATTANEAIMGHDEIDKSQFGIFGSGSSQTYYELIKQSENNKSVMRGTVFYNDPEEVVKLIMGTQELDEENKTYLEGVPVTLDNVDEYME